MFAPIMIGIAFDIVSVFAPTMMTTIEVVAELDCTMLVARIPTKSPTKGFPVVRRSHSAKPKLSLNSPNAALMS
jgi:hypothetical protein